MNWLKFIPAFFQLFKEGKELNNAATWKTRTVATNMVIAFLGTVAALAKNAGYDLQIGTESLSNLGTGVVAVVGLVNAVMHLITDKRIGMSSNIGGGSGQGPTADTGQSPAI
jgi:hypothetical protein